RLASGAGERNEVAVALQRFGFVRDAGRLRSDMAVRIVIVANVPRGDQNRADDLRIVSGGGSSHESAHAVADENDVTRINAILLRVRGIKQEADLGVCVFGRMLEDRK